MAKYSNSWDYLTIFNKIFFFRVRRSQLSSLTQSCQFTDILLLVGNRQMAKKHYFALSCSISAGWYIWRHMRVWKVGSLVQCILPTACFVPGPCAWGWGVEVGGRMCLIQIDIRLPVILIVFIIITYEPSSVPKHIHNNLFVFFFVLIIQIENS